MSPTIIDTKELHYNFYYKGLEANKIHKITFHHKITMSPTIIENRKLLSSSLLVCSSTCTKQSFRGHIHMMHKASRSMARSMHICIKMHMQWPLYTKSTKIIWHYHLLHKEYIQITCRSHIHQTTAIYNINWSHLLTRLREWAASFFLHERPCVTQGL